MSFQLLFFKVFLLFFFLSTSFLYASVSEASVFHAALKNVHTQQLDSLGPQAYLKQLVHVRAPSEDLIVRARFSLQGKTLVATVNADGVYGLLLPSIGQFRIQVSAPSYESIEFSIRLRGQAKPPIYVVLPSINFYNEALLEQDIDPLQLSEAALEGVGGDLSSPYLLQATRDVFLGSAAFDFGQAFFKIKSLDARYGKVFMNGVPMNKWFNGRPQWSDWGGLNSLTRAQTYTHGLTSVSSDFGGLLGSTHIDIRPAKLRPGWRFSSSFSNRSYAIREMFSYVSPSKNGFSMAFGGSYRGAKRGYSAGTPYKALSALWSGAYQSKNRKHLMNLTALYVYNKRGRSAALTQEVFSLFGRDYNPYWGNDNGHLRNSRNKTLRTKTIVLNYQLQEDAFGLEFAAAHIAGTDMRSRLSYFNAPNPDPTYYKKLPSYYVNSPIGANFFTAQMARTSLEAQPQIPWDKLYEANENLLVQDRLAYLVSQDVLVQHQWSALLRAHWKINVPHEIDFGFEWRLNPIDQYAQIVDVLGGERHRDIDPFSQTLNDVTGELYKQEQDIFGYHYQLKLSGKRAYIQWRGNFRHWDAFASLSAQERSGFRVGKMQNERYLSNALGESDRLHFSTFKFKAGLTYKINGRHHIQLSVLKGSEPPLASNWFINPRDRPLVSPNLKSESVFWTSANYHLRGHKIMGRLNVFHGLFKGQHSLRYFFTETSLGSDFVQEWVSDQNTRHMGVEFGFQYRASSAITFSFSGSLGQYTLSNNPNVALFFDPGEDALQPNNTEGFHSFGRANLKGSSLALGPARAFSLGVSYRDPSYWWVSLSLNTLGLSYVGPSYLRHTESFLLADQSAQGLLAPTTTAIAPTQRALPTFNLMNLVAGKSWLVAGKYTSLFLSVNNLMNQTYRSGGYEQSRKAGIESYTADQLSGQPSFDTKYWYGSGRTFFLNLSYSFPPKSRKTTQEHAE